MQKTRKLSVPSKRVSHGARPPSRKRSSAKSLSKRSNQRTRPELKVARNQVALANPVTEAVAVTAEVTAGAIEATGNVAAAAANMAQCAAEALGAISTGAAPDQGVEDGKDGGGRA